MRVRRLPLLRPLTHPPSQALIFNANRLEFRRDHNDSAHYVPAEQDAWVTLTSVKPEHEADERAYMTMNEFRSKNSCYPLLKNALLCFHDRSHAIRCYVASCLSLFAGMLIVYCEVLEVGSLLFVVR